MQSPQRRSRRPIEQYVLRLAHAEPTGPVMTVDVSGFGDEIKRWLFDPQFMAVLEYSRRIAERVPNRGQIGAEAFLRIFAIDPRELDLEHFDHVRAVFEVHAALDIGVGIVFISEAIPRECIAELALVPGWLAADFGPTLCPANDVGEHAPTLVEEPDDERFQAIERRVRRIVSFVTIRISRRADIDAAMNALREECEAAQAARREASALSAAYLYGSSEAMHSVREKIRRLAEWPNVDVLVLGERGTGKGLVARALHVASWPSASFEIMDEHMLRGELFPSALAGARHAGKLDAAGSGTVLLDEVGDLSREVQARLHLVLSEPRPRRRRGHRIVAATNVDLARRCREGAFSPSLYQLLAREIIRVPSLREHREDIPEIATALVDRFATASARAFLIDREAIEELTRYDWPGNVRELENVICRSAVAGGGHIGRAEVIAATAEPFACEDPGSAYLPAPAPRPEAPLSEDLRAAYEQNETRFHTEERRIVLATLRKCGGVKSAAAKHLGINPRTFHCIVDRLEIDPEEIARMKRPA